MKQHNVFYHRILKLLGF